MPQQLSRFVSRGLVSGLITLMAFLPLSTVGSIVYAEDGCQPPDTSGQPGVHRPVGSDAAAYHYDCDSGLWVSAHYTYNPATGATTPNDPVKYTYNSTTGKYDTQAWVYNAPQGTYVLVTTAVSQPPAGATVIGGPPAPSSSTIGNTGVGSNNTINNNGNGGGSNSINGTGAGSNNTIDGNHNTNTNSNNSNNLSMNNQLGSTATSGSAAVLQNTTAGSATSGSAQGIENIVNLLQSSSSALGSGNVVTFVQNIDGDVNGDLYLDPSALGTVQPASGQPGSNDNLTINNETNASINNDIDVHATSGDATVSENTTAGDATTGSAQAIANVVNVINSAISSGQSFIGTININGNLNGDILIPPSFIEQLIASNVPTVTISMTGADSNNTVNNNGSSTTNAKNTNNMGITNNVVADAQSGEANVSENTTAGNATSGNADTSITAFNLTGSNVIGSNAILVFVNVLGSWVGMIVNAPAGATAASLGGGISNTGAGSNNTINDNGSDTTNIDNKNNAQINNNIHVAAKSGDANVTRNTNAGNAKSGDAKAAVNLMNIQNSSLSLTNWFGILFINVFGSWHGSFGVNTSAGDPVAAAGGQAGSASGAAGGSSTAGATQFFRFVPNSGGNNSNATGYSVSALGGSAPSNDSGTPGSVLAAAHNLNVKSNAPKPVLQSPDHNTFGRTAFIIGSLVVLFIVSDALYTRRHPERA